jgi:hypothetical protein
MTRQKKKKLTATFVRKTDNIGKLRKESWTIFNYDLYFLKRVILSQGDNTRLFILNGRLTSRFYLIKLNKLSHLFAFVFIAFQSPLTRGRCGLSHHAGACAKRAILHVYFLPKITVAKVRLSGNFILYFLEQNSY